MWSPLDTGGVLGVLMTQDISLSVWAESGQIPGAARFCGNQGRWFGAHTLDRRLCISSRYVGAVLTDSLLLAAPIQSIETDVSAFLNMKAVPRGARSFHLVAADQGFLSAPPKLAKFIRPPHLPQRGTRREKESRGVPSFERRSRCSTPGVCASAAQSTSRRTC
jgi:hypothetical protein